MLLEILPKVVVETPSCSTFSLISALVQVLSGGHSVRVQNQDTFKVLFFFSSPCPVRFLCGDSRTDSTGHLRHEWMQWRQSYNIDEGGVSNTTVKREVNLHCRSWQFPYEWGEVNYHTRYHNLEKKNQHSSHKEPFRLFLWQHKVHNFWNSTKSTTFCSLKSSICFCEYDKSYVRPQAKLAGKRRQDVQITMNDYAEKTIRHS